MNTNEIPQAWMRHFSLTIPSLGPQIQEGNFKIGKDDSGKLYARWLNTNILCADGEHALIIGKEMFAGRFELRSTLIGIEMTAKKEK